MSRYTINDLRRLLNNYCYLNNIPKSATWDHKTRTWSNKFLHLDTNHIYGGHVLMWVKETTGETYFDLKYRLNTREMHAYLKGLQKGAEQTKEA